MTLKRGPRRSTRRTLHRQLVHTARTAPVPPRRPLAGPHRPTPTIRTLILCLPGTVPTAALHDDAAAAGPRLALPGRMDARFWVRTGLRPWHRKHLIGLRPPQQGLRYCAGGPADLLALTAMRHGAANSAALRHHCWSTVVRGTPAATPWTVLWHRHLERPARYPHTQAVADFEAQPRVQAMRLHNAAVLAGPALDPLELDIFQAGNAAYCHFHSMKVICGDAVLTADGTRLQPDSDHLTDRIAYLSTAIRHLDSIDRRQRLLAVTL